VAGEQGYHKMSSVATWSKILPCAQCGGYNPKLCRINSSVNNPVVLHWRLSLKQSYFMWQRRV